MRVATSIAEFTEAELEAFADCLFTKEFLAFVEEEHRGRATARYFVIHDDHGLAAFAPAYEYTTPVPFTFQLDAFLPAAASLAGPADRHLVVYAPIRLRSKILGRTQADRGALLTTMVEWANDAGITAILLPFVLGSDHTLREILTNAGFAAAFYEGDFYLPLSGSDLEEYLQHLPREHRKQFRNDINRLRRSTTIMEDLDEIADQADTLASLHRALMERHGRTEAELTPDTFRRFATMLRRRNVVVARQNGRLIGFAMSIHGQDVFHLLRYGRHAQADEHARVYSNLVYVSSVRRAIQLGVSRVHFGKASHRAKVLRGCQWEEGIVYALLTDRSAHAKLTGSFSNLDTDNRAYFARQCQGTT